MARPGGRAMGCLLWVQNIDGLVQERCNSTANALELHHFCPSIWFISTFAVAMLCVISCYNLPCYSKCKLKWGYLCHKLLSRAWIWNDIPQYCLGCNHLFMLSIPASGPEVLKYLIVLKHRLWLCRTKALAATVICWMYPTLNKFYLILSYLCVLLFQIR